MLLHPSAHRGCWLVIRWQRADGGPRHIWERELSLHPHCVPENGSSRVLCSYQTLTPASCEPVMLSTCLSVRLAGTWDDCCELWALCVTLLPATGGLDEPRTSKKPADVVSKYELEWVHTGSVFHGISELVLGALKIIAVQHEIPKSWGSSQLQQSQTQSSNVAPAVPAVCPRARTCSFADVGR